MFFVISILITGGVFTVAYLLRGLSSSVKVREVQVLQTNLTDQRHGYTFLKSIESYDSSGRLLKTRVYNPLKNRISETINKYDKNGMLAGAVTTDYTSEKDSVVQNINYIYSRGRLIEKITDPLHFTLYVYNEKGLLESEKEFNKLKSENPVHSSLYTYGKNGRPMQRDDSLGIKNQKVTKYFYGFNSNLVRQQQGENIIDFRYNGNKEKSGEIHKEGERVIYKLEYNYDYYPKSGRDRN